MPPKFQRWKGIMKCYPFEEKRLAKWTPPYIVQPKYDGVRCRAIPLDNGSYLLLSSEENVIYSVPHITEALSKHNYHKELDGELYCHGMSFEEIFSRTSRTVNLHPQYEMIQYHIFDYISKSNQPQANRLGWMLLGNKFDHPPLMMSPYWLCESLDDIMRTYDHLIELGYEGIIVRHCQAPYERKRSLYVMKFKPKKEDNYVIRGFKEEITVEGTPKGRLGALVCESGDGHTFAVGTGFTDRQRINLWKSRDTLAGSTIKVQYQHMTSGKKVPRFPVFVDVLKGEENA